MMRTGLVYDPVYKEHRPSPGHPEAPARCDAVLEGIRRAVPAERLVRIPPRSATDEDLALCHTRSYIEMVREDVRDAVSCLRTGDTDVCPRSMEVACRAVGGLLAAVDAVMDGRVTRAFCLVRPPGHHAETARGMGFCIFNNVAIAARYACRRYALERILIVDWDVHHGNGTQEIFYEDPSVFYFSTHQWPLYPGTGRATDRGTGPGRGTTLNCPMAAGSGRREFLEAFEKQLAPAMRRFRPQLVLISAGFDAEAGDPLGGLALAPEDFAELTRKVGEIADASAQGRLLSALEGGYRLEGLAACAGAHVAALAAGA